MSSYVIALKRLSTSTENSRMLTPILFEKIDDVMQLCTLTTNLALKNHGNCAEIGVEMESDKAVDFQDLLMNCFLLFLIYDKKDSLTSCFKFLESFNLTKDQALFRDIIIAWSNNKLNQCIRLLKNVKEKGLALFPFLIIRLMLARSRPQSLDKIRILKQEITSELSTETSGMFELGLQDLEKDVNNKVKLSALDICVSLHFDRITVERLLYLFKD